jgi:CBS domain-containing protein
MNIKSLISPEFPVLSLDDTGDKALRLMSEFRVFHLPLIQRDNYIALISEDDLLDWDTPEEPLSLAEFLTFRPAIFEQKHPYDAMKLAREQRSHITGLIHWIGISVTSMRFHQWTGWN